MQLWCFETDRFYFLLFKFIFYFFIALQSLKSAEGSRVCVCGCVRAHDKHLKRHFRIHICVHLQSLFGQYITVVFVRAKLIRVHEQLQGTAENEN